VIAHIVLFEPRPDLSREARQSFLTAIRDAVAAIEEVKAAEIGRIVSIGQMTDNNYGHSTYSYAALFRFDSEAALGRYLSHPAHDTLRTLFWQSCAATLIADVELDELSDSVFRKLVE
jgi:hypothetical protein